MGGGFIPPPYFLNERVLSVIILSVKIVEEKMIARSANPIFDVSLCAGQGALIGAVSNAALDINSITPINAALFCGGLAATEKVVNFFMRDYLPGSESWIGPIPYGIKNLTSYSISALLVINAMHLSGLILTLPFSITIAGGVAAVALAVACIAKAIIFISKSLKSPEQIMKEIAASKVKSNQVVNFPYKGKNYLLRIVNDPTHNGGVSFGPNGCQARCIIAAKKALPEELVEKIKKLLSVDQGVMVASGRINDKQAFDYFAAA